MGVSPPLLETVWQEDLLNQRKNMGSPIPADWEESPYKLTGASEQLADFNSQLVYGPSFAVSSGQADSEALGESRGVLKKPTPGKYRDSGHLIPSSRTQRDYAVSVSATNEDFQRLQSTYDINAMGRLVKEEDGVYDKCVSHLSSVHIRVCPSQAQIPISAPFTRDRLAFL